MLAPAVLLCTLSAAPLAFVSANMAAMIFDDTDGAEFGRLVANSTDVGVLGGALSLVALLSVHTQLLSKRSALFGASQVPERAGFDLNVLSCAMQYGLFFNRHFCLLNLPLPAAARVLEHTSF